MSKPPPRLNLVVGFGVACQEPHAPESLPDSQCNLSKTDSGDPAKPRLHRLTGIDPAVVFQAATLSRRGVSKPMRNLSHNCYGLIHAYKQACPLRRAYMHCPLGLLVRA